MEITWLGILAIAILIFTGYGGYRKGFVREIMSFFFVFLIFFLYDILALHELDTRLYDLI